MPEPAGSGDHEQLGVFTLVRRLVFIAMLVLLSGGYAWGIPVFSRAKEQKRQLASQTLVEFRWRFQL